MPAKKLAEHEIKFLLTAQNKTKTSFGAVKTALPSIKTLALSAGAAITAMGAAAVAVARIAIPAFADFESALVDVGRVTDQSLDDVKKTIMSLPPELGNATDLVRGYYNVISAGVTEPKAALDLLTTAAKASNAGHLDLKETVAGLTNIMDGMKGAFESSTEAADKLFTIEKIGKIEFQNLIPVIGQVASSANLLNVSVDELGGLLATVSKTAGSTEASATQVKAVFASLLKPTADMSKALETMGFSSGALAIKSIGLKDTMVGLNEQIESGSFTAAELFSKQRALIGIGPALKDNFSSLSKNIEAMGKSAGATDAAFDRWKKTLDGVWQTFKNTIGKMAIRIGQELAPDIKQALTDMGGWLNDNSDDIVRWARTFIQGFKDIIKFLAPFKDAVVGAFVFLKDNLPPLIKPIVKSLVDFKDGLLGVKEQAEKTKDGTKKSFDEMNKLKLKAPKAPDFDPADALSAKGAGSLLRLIGKTLGGGVADFEGFMETVKVKLWKTLANTLRAVGDFVADIIIEFEKIIGIDFSKMFLGFIDGVDRFRESAKKMQKEMQSIKDVAEEVKETLSIETEVKVNTVPITNELKELTKQVDDLQVKFSDMELTITVNERGELKFSNIKDELEDASWDKALSKNFTISSGEASTAVSSVSTAIDSIPETKTTTLTVDITDIQTKAAAVKTAITITSEAFIKQNEKLLKPFRDSLGALPKELTDALESGRKVILTEGGYIITDIVAAMKAAVKTEVPKVGASILATLDQTIRENIDIPEKSITALMDNMVTLMLSNRSVFKETGQSMITAIKEGIITTAPELEVVMLKAIQENIDDYLPHSPAKKGPLANIDDVGGNLIRSISDGIISEAGTLGRAMTDALGGVLDALQDLGRTTDQMPPINIKTNSAEILRDLQTFTDELDSIPDEIVKTITIPTDAASENIVKIKEELAEIPAEIIAVINVDNLDALANIDATDLALDNIPDITDVIINVDTDNAMESIIGVVGSLRLVPDISRTLSVDTSAAMDAIDAVKNNMESIPEVTYKTLVMRVVTEASPRQPFSEGMTSIEDRINNLPGRRNLIIDTEVPGGGRGLNVPSAVRSGPVNQNIDITVNIKANEVSRGNVDVIADDIGRALARKLNTHRATELNDAIKRI